MTFRYPHVCLAAGLLGLAVQSAMAAPAAPFESIPGSFITTEDGSSLNIGIRLTSPPTDDVTLSFDSGDMTEGSISGSLTFTSSNWNQLQYATLTPGSSGDGNDGDVMYSIEVEASSVDPAFNGEILFVDVTNQNVEGFAGISVDVDDVLVSEIGTTASIQYALTMAPSNDVTLNLTSSATAEGTVSPASLTFTSGNWFTPQTATITGVDDSTVDGAVTFTVSASATSLDVFYNGVSTNVIPFANLDDDAAFTVSAISGDTSEDGDTATFTIVMSGEPSDDVVLAISSDDTTEGTVSPNTVTFTNANWNTSQTITVTGVNDTLEDGDIAFNVVIDAAVTTDINFHGIDPDDVNVTNTDTFVAASASDSESSRSSDSDDGWNCSLNGDGSPDGSLYMLMLLAAAHLIRKQKKQWQKA